MVNAMDGDGVLYQDDLDALGVRILPGYNSGFSNHNMPYTTGEVARNTGIDGQMGMGWVKMMLGEERMRALEDTLLFKSI